MSNFENAFPVLLVWEYFDRFGFFGKTTFQESWELSCNHYEMFLSSDYNKTPNREIDILPLSNRIRQYVNAVLVKEGILII